MKPFKSGLSEVLAGWMRRPARFWFWSDRNFRFYRERECYSKGADSECHVAGFVFPGNGNHGSARLDKSIEDQLSKGIRFFDLRVAHKPNDPSDDLYFTHVIYTHLTVLKTLECVEHWLNSHPKEVVILACSHFEGMDDACHELFISHLKKLFCSKLCPRKEPVLSLRSLWASGYQVILSYESQLVARHPQLWPAIPYWWANKTTAQEVIRYLDWNKDMGRPEGFFVSGLNLTAPRSYIAKNPKESLRTLTFSNWECLREWVEQQRPGSDPHSLNIIAGDFVGPLPLCSLVIGLNHKLRPKISARPMKEQQQQ
ncbi:PI-PLC X domain-containing protein 1-like isoform X1 [Xiphophorus maculatus]|uniref:PI-PLC X domain-containing protein 1-like isoform X1 n=1 Tax=Xiphophorus maculatus TaxID=8083 RepID=UPI000C6CD9AF|nr:PI-PLC X domain-containing protein 1-like isoform X1 [Xiphophorus maculatus]